MISVALSDFAFKNKLRATATAVFGVYNNQLVTIAEESNERTLRLTILQNASVVLNEFIRLPCVHKLKIRNKIKLENDYIIIQIRGLQAFSIIGFSNFIDTITKELTTIYVPQFTGDLVLWNQRVFPRNMIDFESLTLEEPKIEYNLFLTVLLCGVSACAMAVLLAVFPSLLPTVKLLPQAYLIVGFLGAVPFYRNRILRQTILSKLIFSAVLLTAMSCGIVAEVVFRLFQDYLITAGIVWFHIKARFGNEWVYLILSYGLALIASFNIRDRKADYRKVEEGKEITSQDYELKRSNLKLTKLVVLLIIGIFSAYLLSIYLMYGRAEGHNTEIGTRFWWIGGIASAIAFTIQIGIYYSKRRKKSKLTVIEVMTSWFTVITLMLFISVMSGMTISDIFVWLNYRLDKQPSKATTMYLGHEYIRPIDQIKCYRVVNPKSGDEISSSQYCENEYTDIKNSEPVELNLHDGFFKMPWATDITLSRYKNFETLYTSLPDKGLIHFEVFKRYYNNPKDHKIIEDKFYNVWKNNCASRPSSECRLASYVAEINGKDAEKEYLLYLGCMADDEKSCYGLTLRKQASEDDKKRYIECAKRQCDRGDLESCKGLVYAYNKESYVKNYREIILVNKKMCIFGNAFACQKAEEASYLIPKNIY